MDNKNLYSIGYVSRQTGLTPHVIRAWEKRYRAVVPRRSAKNRRLYSGQELQRLGLLKKITDAGHTISQVAKLDTSELSELARLEGPPTAGALKNDESLPQPASAPDYAGECLSAVLNLDPIELERAYDRAAVDLTRAALVRELIVPLFQEIGRLWRKGSLKILNEHMATLITRSFLMNLLRATEISDSAPRIVIATPVGQWHDTGALTVAVTIAEYGWRPLYYGPNLPAEEIAAAVKLNRARAVAVSITHLLESCHLIDEMRKLRRYIGKDAGLIVGGQCVSGYAHLLEEINAKLIVNLDQLSDELDSLLSRTIRSRQRRD